MSNTNSFSGVLRLTLSSANASQRSSNDVIRRTAIDESAAIGSLYNVITDSINGQLLIKIKPECRLLQKTVCNVVKGNTPESKNLLEMIGIDGEQRLSLMLNMIPAAGISSLFISPISTNKYTRFLYYCYSREDKYIPSDPIKIRANIPENLPETNATHVITEIKFGTHVLIVLQISPTYENYLDDLLERIKGRLTNGIFVITDMERNYLNQITSTKVFSNIPQFVQMTKLTDVCEKIIEIRRSNLNYRPIECTLRPIKWFYPSYPIEKSTYFSIEKTDIDKIEQYLLELKRFIKPLLITFDSQEKTLLEKHHLNQRFEKLQEKIQESKKFHSSQIACIKTLLTEIRSGKDQQQTIDNILSSEQTKAWQNIMKFFINCFDGLKDKLKLIKYFNKKDIIYFNVEQLTIENNNDLNTILRKIFTIDGEYLVFCSTDDLRRQDSSKWDNIYQDWIKRHENNRQLYLIYADFSYCSFPLKEMELLSFNHIDSESKKTQRLSILSDSDIIPSSSSDSNISSIKCSSTVEENPPAKKHCPDHVDSSCVNYINVLLLGESGVGKSTFLNAFINYLAFQNLDEAHSSKPIALIPVSFLMTTGDNFEEHIIKFGNEDLNEDHNHSGQSVTQQCRSYVFNINNKTKLRLIDTPGMGDTRGLDQDDRNIRHILSYINNLEHLNGICILLKPNQSRLNIVFRSYFDQLLKFLGSNARHNILFCFTNTRSTFYSPGDTAPLLKSMIKTHSIKDIPFEKSNTFCFDSESFRYLIALQNGIQFDDYQQQEFRQSWIKSVPESKRMFKYISETLTCYPHDQWRSIEHVRFQIIQLIRPMLETTRNIHRNIILLDQSSTETIINLRPDPCSQFSSICYTCERSPKLYGDFWIIPDDFHLFQDKCNKCSHSFKNHIMVDYELKYELSNKEDNQSISEMETILDRIKNAIQEFAPFFGHIFRDSDQIDPILSALDRMINEEDYICKKTKLNNCNLILYNKLIALRKEHEGTRRKSLSYEKDIDLNHMYTLIKDICQIELIKKQMDIIKQGHYKYMEEHQIEIPHKLTFD